MNLTIEIPIHLSGRGRRRRSIQPGPAPVPAALPEGTIPRISRLMALAIHFDRLLASGAVGSLAELARSMRVTRARISQIMALNRLAPEIQEALLFLPRTVSGRAPITEHDLRAVAAEADWGRQTESIERLPQLPQNVANKGLTHCRRLVNMLSLSYRGVLSADDRCFVVGIGR